MLQGNGDDEEEFVVIRAGPPLPLRRPRPARPLKTLPTHTSEPLLADLIRVENVHGVNCPFHKHAFKPAIDAGTLFSPQSNQVSLGPATSSKIPVSSSKNVVSPAPTPLQPTQPPPKPSKSKPSKSTGSTRSRSPTPSLPSGSIHQKSPRPPTPTLNVESKVKQYIEQVKRFDEEQRCKSGVSKKKFLSLEDLYQVTTPLAVKNDPSQMEEKLRETLRIIKEKDEMIDTLRESCHELKLKCADAENRIDEMRFGVGFQGAQKSKGQSTFSLVHTSTDAPRRSASETIILKRSRKGIHTEQPTTKNNVSRDKATETEWQMKSVGIDARSHKTRSQSTDVDDEGYLYGEAESRESTFDPVLEEKCCNWLEKVQNWKTDPKHRNNAGFEISKDKDSCGDSGFRECGSAAAAAAALVRSSTPAAELDKPSKVSPSLMAPLKTKDSAKKQSNPVDIVSHSIPILAAHFIQKQQNNIASVHEFERDYQPSSPSNDEFSPTSLQIAQPWHIFTGNVNPYSATEYEGFPSYNSHHHRSLSLDKLNPYNCGGGSGSRDFSRSHMQINDHCDLLRNIDKSFKALHPLLDTTITMAVRTKKKSDNLAKIISARTQGNVHATPSSEDLHDYRRFRRATDRLL